jgi:methionyl aminopeptidase
MRQLQDGDIVNIDISVYYQGMHADLNETFCVGTKVPAKNKLLIKATHDSLMRSIEKVGPGMMFRDFGAIISKQVGMFGFDVVRTYVLSVFFLTIIWIQ